MIQFTLEDGKLVLDEDKGSPDGPRVIDPHAGLVRFGDLDHTLPLAELRLVAVVYVERELRQTVDGASFLAPRMTHAVVLVPRRLPAEVAALLDEVAATGELPRGQPIWGASAAVDQVSVQFCLAGDALTGRTTAKAIARLAHLPMVELYGELPVFREADRLDLSLRDCLERSAPPADPGPPPAGLVAVRQDGRLKLSLASGPRPTRLWLLLAPAAAAVVAPLFWITPVVGVVCLLLVAGAVALFLRGRRRSASMLILDRDQIQWQEAGRDESLEISRLEMMRVHETTLVLISHQDEIRCNFPSEGGAAWARRAIEHHLAAPAAGPYR